MSVIMRMLVGCTEALSMNLPYSRAGFQREQSGHVSNFSGLEINFNKIAPFGKEDTAKELQDHAAKRACREKPRLMRKLLLMERPFDRLRLNRLTTQL